KRIDALCGEKLGFAFDPGKRRGRRLRPEQYERMRIKRDDNRCAAQPLAHGAQLAEEFGVAAMNAVKISDGDRTPLQGRRQRGGIANNLHGDFLWWGMTRIGGNLQNFFTEPSSYQAA